MENRDCERVLDLLNQYIDGELNGSDAEFVRAHIETCEACRKAYNELIEIEKLFAESTAEAPNELYESVMAKIRKENSAIGKRRKFTRIFSGVAVAAVISLTVITSPAILLIANGGAKAECNDMAEALAPSKGENADNSYSGGMEPEYGQIDDHLTSNDGKYDILDSIKDINDRLESLETLKPETTESPKIQYGKEYDAYLSDGSKTSIIFTESIATLGGSEFEYKVNGDLYILTDGEEALVFNIVYESSGGELFFKQQEKTND